ncbi:MAG: NADH-quinone oxidoreductase subunit H [Myxococcales bacterium]|nr:NADH-quinone oxidoreductase subunit H [Myxococcales bacterium]
MSLELVALAAGKALFMVMFGMNVAVVLTWADRRQGAMINDRVGPNRAVAWLPRRVAQGMVLTPAILIAVAVVGYVYTHKVEGAQSLGRAMVFSHLAIFALWAGSLAIGGRVASRGVKNSFDGWVKTIGDPRSILWMGLGAHAVTFLAAALLRGTDIGRALRVVGSSAGPAVFATALVGAAGYAAWSFNSVDKVGLRLFGLLHPAADGLKTIWKEDFIPPNSDKLLHSLAPIISFFPALVVMAVVPFGDTLCFGMKQGHIDLTALQRVVGREGLCAEGAVPLQVLDVNVGILYFFAIAGTGIVGAALAGWASDNKFSLLGGLRAASQMVSYEVTLGLTVVGAIMVYGTLRIDEMVRWQAANTWGIFVQPLAFVLFFTAAVAESKRIPFDLPEGESELVAGYFTEYSGMKFAMFFFAEYVAVVASSALLTVLFLGGWHLPFIDRSGLHIQVGDTVLLHQSVSHVAVIVIGVLTFIGKVVALSWLQLMIRWTLPRFRYDQLMRLGWRKLLPASLLNILATGLVMLVIAGASASVQAGLKLAADVTQVVVAVAGVSLLVWFIRFVTSPVKKRRIMSSTAAKFAAQLGGTRTARMGA